MLSSDLKQEARPMLRLALPVVLGEIGWVSLGVVDVMMVGRLDAASIGAVSIGRVAFITVMVFGLGLLLGLDTAISRSFGAGARGDCHAWLLHGVYLSLLISLPLMLGARGIALGLGSFELDPQVHGRAVAYLLVVSWSMLPLFGYFTFRRYLQAVNQVRPVMIALVSANLVNAACNWLLIFGKLGFPALGVVGAAWSSVLSAVYLALFLLAAILLAERRSGSVLRRWPARLEPHRLSYLLRLGIPAALQLLLEIGAIALLTLFAGRLAPAALAAHQIALNAASVTYMVPLGISAAAAVRVGQALGRGDGAAAAAAGWTALILGGGFMSFAALTFTLVPEWIVGAFTPLREVIRVGVPLLYVAAVFQLFDGLQIVATGALRGAGDTRTPMLVGLVAYWLLGLPVGYALCFLADLGVFGLWLGLSVGLIVVALYLLPVWARRSAGWQS